jgi:hypothetical protein
MIDDRPTAGDAAHTIVTQLQLQPPSPQTQDDPGAFQMASSKEEDPFWVKGSEVKLSHQPENRNRLQLNAGQVAQAAQHRALANHRLK